MRFRMRHYSDNRNFHLGIYTHHQRIVNWAMATGNVHRKVCEVQICDSWAYYPIYVDDRHSDRRTYTLIIILDPPTYGDRTQTKVTVHPHDTTPGIPCTMDWSSFGVRHRLEHNTTQQGCQQCTTLQWGCHHSVTPPQVHYRYTRSLTRKPEVHKLGLLYDDATRVLLFVAEIKRPTRARHSELIELDWIESWDINVRTYSST